MEPTQNVEQSKAPAKKHISTLVSMRTYRFLNELKLSSSFNLQVIIERVLDEAAEKFYAEQEAKKE